MAQNPDKSYNGISDKKLLHMRSVAEECYRLAIESGMTESEARAAYTMGFIHDIGYAFSPAKGHAAVSAEMLYSVARGNLTHDIVTAIRFHGKPSGKRIDKITPLSRILDTADLSVMPDGNKVSVKERLDYIKARYGKNSEQAINTEELAKELGLI